MAVSMSTGGYMRSDFMISDAAIPMRMEEVDADRDAQFAQLVGGMDAKEVPADLSKADLPEDAEKLAQMIVDGEVSLEEIPRELLTEELLGAIKAALVEPGKPAKPAEDKSKPSPEISQEAAQLAAGFVQTESIPDDKTEELSAISAVISTEEAAVQTAASAEAVPAESAISLLNEPGAANQPKQPETAKHAEAPKQFALSENAEEVPEIPVTASEESEKLESSLNGEQRNALMQAAKNGEISRPEAKAVSRETPEEKPEESTAPEPKRFTAESRVTNAAEELEMLRSAKSRPAQTEQIQQPAQNTPAPAQNPLAADAPIVFARENGGEVTVRPSEVISQAAAKLIDAAKTASEDATEYSIELNPEELGRITVSMTKLADGTVSVTIAAENARTQHILEQNSELMQSNLRESGIRLESWQTVNEAEHSEQPQDYNGSSKNPYHREDAEESGDNPTDSEFAEIMASM